MNEWSNRGTKRIAREMAASMRLEVAHLCFQCLGVGGRYQASATRRDWGLWQ